MTFVDPTGMQVNNYYDVEGVLPIYVPQPIYDPDTKPEYVVNDYNWEIYAMQTSKFLNAQYELYKATNSLTRQATAFIDYNREVAVQEVQISAKQILANDYVGGQGWNTFGNANNGVAFGVSTTFSYVSNSLDRSLKYVTEGVSTIQDIHFKVPDIKIKNWQMPYINLYTQNVGAVRKASKVLKGAGWVTGGIGLYMTFNEILAGQKNWFGEGGLDLIMGGVGFIGPYGWVISCAYFGGKMILESTDNKFW